MPDSPNHRVNHVDNANPVEPLLAEDINGLGRAANDVYNNGAKPKGAAGGALSGTYPNPTLTALPAGLATGAALGTDVLVTGSGAQSKTGNLTVPLIDNGGQVDDARIYGFLPAATGATNSAALQSALAVANAAPQGTVFLAPGTYNLATTLDFTGTHNLRFAGGGGGAQGLGTATRLHWSGAAASTVFKMWDCRDNIIENFYLIGDPGNYMGIAFDITKVGVTVNSTHNRFNNLTVVYSTIAFSVGTGASGNTELMVFDEVYISQAGTGYYFNNTQSKQHQIRGGSLGQCTIAGINCDSGSFHSWATNFSQNAIDVLVNNTLDPCSIIGMMSEGAGRFLDMYGSGLGRPVNVYSGRLSPDNINVDGNYIRTQGVGPLNLHGVDMASGVHVSNWRIFVQGQTIQPALVTTIGCLFPNGTPWNVTAGRGFIRQLSCTYNDGAYAMMLADRNDSATDLRITPGISATSTKANNLRGQVTFATAATAAVVFGTAEVQSLIATGATSGTFQLRFNGATTAALNWNATAAQVQTALVALGSVGTGGVVCTLGPLPNTAITITFAGPLVGGGPQNLITVVGSTLVGGTAAVTRTTAGTGSPPESNTTYYVSLAGNVNETFFVTAKTTTGFTINSSNATSTAVADWHLIR